VTENDSRIITKRQRTNSTAEIQIVHKKFGRNGFLSCFAGQIIKSQNDKSGDCRRAERQIEGADVRIDGFAGENENDNFDRRAQAAKQQKKREFGGNRNQQKIINNFL